MTLALDYLLSTRTEPPFPNCARYPELRSSIQSPVMHSVKVLIHENEEVLARSSPFVTLPGTRGHFGLLRLSRVSELGGLDAGRRASEFPLAVVGI
jgi:hypothetical protein